MKVRVPASFIPPAHRSAWMDYSTSTLLHVLVIILIATSYAFHHKPITLDPDPVTIEIVKIDKKTIAPPQKTVAKPEKGKSKVFNSTTQAKAQPKPEPNKVEKSKQDTVKPDAPAPDEAIALKVKPEVVEQKKPNPQAAPTVPLKDKTSAAKDMPTPKLKTKPTTVINTTVPIVENKKDTFDDVVKAVADMREKALDLEKDKEAKKHPPRENQHETAKTMTISEIDAFRRQLMSCWTPPAGIKNAQSIVVEMDLIVKPDATLEDAQIVDQRRLAADPVFRIAAEAALRALNHPACTPLLLPKDKHEIWQNFRLVFNPKDMF